MRNINKDTIRAFINTNVTMLTPFDLNILSRYYSDIYYETLNIIDCNKRIRNLIYTACEVAFSLTLKCAITKEIKEIKQGRKRCYKRKHEVKTCITGILECLQNDKRLNFSMFK